MIATRITRRAATIVAVTLLAAGTAAAAALPAISDADAPTDVAFVPTSTIVESTPTEASEVVVTATATADVVTDGDATGDVAALPVAEPGATVHDPKTANHFGKCTAWTHGAEKKLTNPAFAKLQTAADADGTVSVDEYCAATIAAHEAEHGDEADVKADEADEAAGADEVDDEVNDEADDEADEVDDEDDADEVGRGNGKSDHDSAARGKGHGKRD